MRRMMFPLVWFLESWQCCGVLHGISGSVLIQQNRSRMLKVKKYLLELKLLKKKHLNLPFSVSHDSFTPDPCKVRAFLVDADMSEAGHWGLEMNFLNSAPNDRAVDIYRMFEKGAHHKRKMYLHFCTTAVSFVSTDAIADCEQFRCKT